MTRNVVAVMLDTLQFNYLGCYGNPWIRTPNIDRFSQQGVQHVIEDGMLFDAKKLVSEVAAMVKEARKKEKAATETPIATGVAR